MRAVSEPRTITLTARAGVAVGLFAVLMIVLLAAQLVFIVQQRGIVDDQRHIALRGEERSARVLDAARALLGSPEQADAAVQRAGTALGELEAVLRTVRETEVAEIAASALRRAPDLLRDVNHAVAVLDRTDPTLRSSLRIQTETLSILRRSLDIQERTLTVAGETRGVAETLQGLTTELRDIGRTTLARVESLDRKTGGPAPPVVP